MKQRPINPKSLAYRSMAFSIAMFVFVIVAGGVIFTLSMRQIIRENKRAELVKLLEIERIKLENLVMGEIATALKMAGSPLIIKHFLNPSDDGLRSITFEELESYRKASGDNTVFWVSDTDKRFYSGDAYVYTMDPNDPKDYWYPMTLQMPASEKYNFNINYNEQVGKILLWINAVVRDTAGKSVGVLGKGIDLSSFTSSIYNDYDDKADLYFFNALEEITGAKDTELVSEKRKLRAVFGEELGRDIFAAARILEPGKVAVFNSARGETAVISVPMLHWYAAAILPVTVADYDTTMTILFAVMLAAIAVILVIFNVFIAKLSAPLQTAMDDLENASRSKSDFLATMSHEIRTPMNGVIGFCEIALGGEIPPDTRDCLTKIKSSAAGLLSIINDILDVSKIEAGKITLESIPLDLHQVLDDCRTIVAHKAADKGIELFCYAEPSVHGKLLGDPTRLRQILLNLLSNAVKFTNTGIVKLLTSIVTSDDDSVTIHFEVKDSGIGMTEEQMDKLFEKFAQADNSITRKYGGTGLGLTIAKNLVELMGGTMRVESVPGVGTKFSFELKFNTVGANGFNDDTPAYQAAAPVNTKPTFNAEILVCEDNDINKLVISRHLSMVGIRTVIVSNGKDGVDTVRKRMEENKPFDLIFMDIQMPVMDGLEASKLIVQMGCETPIVALTANVMVTDREIYKQAGIHDYLGKPFMTQELWNCLLKYLTPVSVNAADGDEQARDYEKMRRRLHENFLSDNRDTFNNIKAALDSGDTKTARRLAHTLKGLAGLIGKTKLSEVAGAIEENLRREETVSTIKMSALEVELSSVMNELSRSVNERKAADDADKKDAASLDEDKAAELLDRLERMFKIGAVECLELVDDLRGIAGTEELIDCIERFDFESAAAALKIVKQKRV